MKRQPRHDRDSLIASAAQDLGITHLIAVETEKVSGVSRNGDRVEVRVPKAAGVQSITNAVAELARRIRG